MYFSLSLNLNENFTGESKDMDCVSVYCTYLLLGALLGECKNTIPQDMVCISVYCNYSC